MSIAEFYIDNGLDPSDPHHMDRFFGHYVDESDYESSDDSENNYNTAYSGLMIAMPNPRIGRAVVVHNQNQPRARNHVLDEDDLDQLALSNGYQILDASSSTAPMASYRKGAVRLNFWLSTGTVGSYLEHPRQGKTQLFRRDVTMMEAEGIFVNPRMHTGRGYQYARNGGGGRGLCRYRDRCYRPDCWFDH